MAIREIPTKMLIAESSDTSLNSNSPNLMVDKGDTRNNVGRVRYTIPAKIKNNPTFDRPIAILHASIMSMAILTIWLNGNQPIDT